MVKQDGLEYINSDGVLILPSFKPSEKLCGTFRSSSSKGDFVNNWLRGMGTTFTILFQNFHCLVCIKKKGWANIESSGYISLVDLPVCTTLWIKSNKKAALKRHNETYNQVHLVVSSHEINSKGPRSHCSWIVLGMVQGCTKLSISRAVLEFIFKPLHILHSPFLFQGFFSIILCLCNGWLGVCSPNRLNTDSCWATFFCSNCGWGLWNLSQ